MLSEWLCWMGLALVLNESEAQVQALIVMQSLLTLFYYHHIQTALYNIS